MFAIIGQCILGWIIVEYIEYKVRQIIREEQRK